MLAFSSSGKDKSTICSILYEIDGCLQGYTILGFMVNDSSITGSDQWLQKFQQYIYSMKYLENLLPALTVLVRKWELGSEGTISFRGWQKSPESNSMAPCECKIENFSLLKPCTVEVTHQVSDTQRVEGVSDISVEQMFGVYDRVCAQERQYLDGLNFSLNDVLVQDQSESISQFTAINDVKVGQKLSVVLYNRSKKQTKCKEKATDRLIRVNCEVRLFISVFEDLSVADLKNLCIAYAIKQLRQKLERIDYDPKALSAHLAQNKELVFELPSTTTFSVNLNGLKVHLNTHSETESAAKNRIRSIFQLGAAVEVLTEHAPSSAMNKGNAPGSQSKGGKPGPRNLKDNKNLQKALFFLFFIAFSFIVQQYVI